MENFQNTVSNNTSQSSPNVSVSFAIIGVDNSQEEVETSNISSASSNTHDPSSPMRKRNDENEPSEGAYKCPVCLEIVCDREPLLTKCGHVFCRPCIETAIRYSHKCPRCNMEQDIHDTMRIYL
ncbi:E3 ubiquitin-protein ligase RNF125-like [Drosophila pseudoobscura]|uniref:E3 ubiquitin-protein ligase RNF125-like n=1 Tax=Drosophila pseudoobscura pseudoobscura TaxID=46245 RepID=B5DMH4_DROPS|nr:E3 ubiquitin-protein ligase RNF125 [Drosophila pseudoobscura]